MAIITSWPAWRMRLSTLDQIGAGSLRDPRSAGKYPRPGNGKRSLTRFGGIGCLERPQTAAARRPRGGDRGRNTALQREVPRRGPDRTRRAAIRADTAASRPGGARGGPQPLRRLRAHAADGRAGTPLRRTQRRNRVRAVPAAAPGGSGRERAGTPLRARPHRAAHRTRRLAAPPPGDQARREPRRPDPGRGLTLDCARRGSSHRVDRHLRPARAGV